MISVCMATYNGESYIEEQLSSILNQIGLNDEIIVSDDNSTDNTIAKIESFHDSRIQILINDPLQKGYTKNFGNSLKRARGDVIFLSDQDDVWANNKVTMTLEALRDADFCVSDAEVVDQDLHTLYPSHFDFAHVKKGFMQNFVKTRYIGACMAFRKDVLMKALPFPNNVKFCAHDYWIAIVAESFFRVRLIEEPLIFYRRHDKNASTGGLVKSNESIAFRIMKRLYCGYHLIRHMLI